MDFLSYSDGNIFLNVYIKKLMFQNGVKKIYAILKKEINILI